MRIPDAPSPWKFLPLKLQSAEQPMNDDQDNNDSYDDSTPRSKKADKLRNQCGPYFR